MLPDDLVIMDDSRGMASLSGMLGPSSPAMRAARSVLGCEQQLLLCTGFPVENGSETDGPAGAIVLGRALRALARGFTIVAWAEALQSWAPALGDLPSLAIPQGARPAALTGAAITIEACGRTADGAYYNMLGVDVGAKAPWFEDAIGLHALVSVGDGGNEFGMGSAPPAWFESRDVKAPASTCDVLVVGQVSNWGVLAIVACLSQLTGRRLLPQPEEYQELLEQLAQGGVLDGVRKLVQPTEDGFEPGRGAKVIASLQHWLLADLP